MNFGRRGWLPNVYGASQLFITSSVEGKEISGMLNFNTDPFVPKEKLPPEASGSGLFPSPQWKDTLSAL